MTTRTLPDNLTLYSGGHRPDEGRMCVMDRQIDGRSLKVSAETRFWSHVQRGPGCWEWQGRLSDDGYGRTSIGNRHNQGAHRAAWEMAVGQIPDGLHVCHTCDNRRCVRPDHLFLGTNHDNILDRQTKGRSKNLFASGEKHPRSALTEQHVREIRSRREAGESGLTIAKLFGITHQQVYRIANHTAWEHIQ